MSVFALLEQRIQRHSHAQWEPLVKALRVFRDLDQLAAAIRRIGAACTALIGNLGPMLTIFLGCWLLNEPLSWWQMAGAKLVLAGVLLISKRIKPIAEPAEVRPQGLVASKAG